MSGWVVGLGLAAGYLINRNVAIQSQLDRSITEFQSAALPSEDGVTSGEIRAAQKKKPPPNGQANERLPKEGRDALEAAQTGAASEGEAYEGPSATRPIVGVWMTPGY